MGQDRMEEDLKKKTEADPSPEQVHQYIMAEKYLYKEVRLHYGMLTSLLKSHKFSKKRDLPKLRAAQAERLARKEAAGGSQLTTLAELHEAREIATHEEKGRSGSNSLDHST